MDVSRPASDRRVPAVPGWVRVADAAAGAVLLLVVWQVLSGGARGGMLRFLVPATSLAALLVVFVGIVIGRHAAQPHPSALERIQARLVQLDGTYPWSVVWRVFVATRLMVFLVAFFAVATLGLARYPGFQLSDDILVNLPARFDAGWYGGIAMNGYQWSGSFERQTDVAFFPAMPMLMRPLGLALGAGDRERPREIRMARMLWGGVAISLGAFLLALVYLARVGRHLVGDEAAGHAVLLLACYPFAFAFSAPYTEALFLLASLASVHHFYRDDWVKAGGWGLLAGLTRPNGFLLTLPLGVILLKRIITSRRAESIAGRDRVLALASAVMPVLGMLAFTVYLVAKTGVWFAWSRSHAAWGRTYDGAEPIVSAWRRLQEQGLVAVASTEPFATLNAAALLFALAMTWPVFRRLGAAWAAYVLVIVIPPALAGGVLSMGRITSTIFPVFLALAVVIPSRAVPGWAVAFAMLQGLCAALFFTWRQLY